MFNGAWLGSWYVDKENQGPRSSHSDGAITPNNVGKSVILTQLTLVLLDLFM